MTLLRRIGSTAIARREHLPDLGKALAAKFGGGRSLLDFCGAFMLPNSSACVNIILKRGVGCLFVPCSFCGGCSIPHPREIIHSWHIRSYRLHLNQLRRIRMYPPQDIGAGQVSVIQPSYPNYPSATNISINAPQPPSGIASRVQELEKCAAETSELAYNLRIALGLGELQGIEGKTVPPSSLSEVLTSLRIRINRANNDFRDVLTHLSS